MEILLSAGVQPGIDSTVEKLRMLRRETQRTTSRRGRAIAAGAGLVFAVSVMVASLIPAAPKRAVSKPKMAFRPKHVAAPGQAAEKIWIAERRSSGTVYSNGLEVRPDYLASGDPRHYRPLSHTLEPLAESSTPAGIVFHTTEGLLVPLTEPERRELVANRNQLLEHIRGNRSYNFVIDRLGQVFQIVPEGEIAFHAGHSIWADGRAIYLDLNSSFIGVSFEARTDGDFTPTPAQVRAGRLLTDMLRATYEIPAENCVTHAQVSVNPANRRIGYHTDWAARFPFAELALPGGYDRSVAAIEFFGFTWDQTFVDQIGGTPWNGIIAAEERLIESAQAHHLTPEVYRNRLQIQYEKYRSRTYERNENSSRS